MLKKALAKLTNRQRETLDVNKSFLAEMWKNGNHDAAIDTRSFIKGYLSALRESEIITENERRALFEYATRGD